ncbi:hypothetical protein VIBNISO65_40010 [Vibrio nigripulchritudo SO65]|nr:hypothetical protein VIBNIAM115_250010 [Vibrio nigripulchritudo AM115]CCN43039.1 hypothetical protein VIBNIFTn2_440010 [Vibrio nigripulchritudo FTn2]CCN65040.1 hypothetical protein VIBNIPon4_310020 [Vibrio nigripulchritudo POn4]CCN77791.1 hypothetical protein VIBNISO65_40010 [Vibrio nigripulchritudo SO65]
MQIFSFSSLGAVDLSRLNFVRARSDLIAAQEFSLVILSKGLATKSKALLAEPFGQRLCVFLSF